MSDGFLGYRTSFMLDVVVCALVAVVPVLLYSIYLVKFRRQYALHKTLQLILGVALLLTVAAFDRHRKRRRVLEPRKPRLRPR